MRMFRSAHPAAAWAGGVVWWSVDGGAQGGSGGGGGVRWDEGDVERLGQNWQSQLFLEHRPQIGPEPTAAGA